MTVRNHSLPGPHLAGEPYAACEEPPRIWCPDGCYGGYVATSGYGGHITGEKPCERCKGLGWTEADGSANEAAELLTFARTIAGVVH